MNKFFDPSTPSMRKGHDGENDGGLMKIVATTSLPAADRPNDTARTTTAGTPHTRAKKEVKLAP